MKKFLLSFLCIAILISGCTNGNNRDGKLKEVNKDINRENPVISEDENNKNQYENNNTINKSEELSKEKKEVQLEKIEDVILVGKLNKFDDVEGLKIYIGNNKELSVDVSNDTILGSRLELKDMDNDGIKDIIIYEFNGGSGNLQNIHIYRRTDNSVVKIMGPEFYMSQDGFYQEYLGDGNVLFEDRNNNFKVEYNIEVPYEEEGWKLDDIKNHFGLGNKAWVDLYYSFEVIDEDNDGIFEVKGNQVVCGIAHVDVIGEISTVYGYINGKYIPRELIYYKISKKNWKKEETGRVVVNK